MYTTQEIKQAIKDYNGRTRIRDEEIHDIKWFIRTKNLSLEKAVEAYYEDREEAKRLRYADYIARKNEICAEIESHCENCKYKDICIKYIMLRHWDLDAVKRVQRSECWNKNYC